MDIKTLYKKVKRMILHAFFTTGCACCGELIEYDKYICDKCKGYIVPIEAPICHKCGKSVNDHDTDLCAPMLSQVVAAYYYGGLVKSLIIDMKSEEHKDNFGIFYDSVIETVAREYAQVDFDIAVCVPSFGDQKYTSSANIAKRVSQAFMFEFDGKVLEKYRETEKQHLLNREDRLVNLENSIKLRPGKCEKIKGKTVLLCDDVKSTGATLNECINVLNANGAKAVYCICVAVSDYGTRQREELFA